MRFLQPHDVADLGLQPDQAAFLHAEFNRKGRVIVPTLRDGMITAVSRYQSGYFHALRETGRLGHLSEDQLVIEAK